MTLSKLSERKVLYSSVAAIAVVVSIITTVVFLKYYRDPSLHSDTKATASYNLQPTADTQVKSGYADKNYGTINSLTTSNYDSNTRRSFLKFDLAPLSGQTITQARLVLTPTIVRTVSKQVKVVSDNSWTETGLKWNNQPAMGSVVGSLNNQATVVGVPVSINLDAGQIQAAVGATLSLVVDNAAGNSTFDVYSKEAGSGKPELVVETSTEAGATAAPTTAATATPTATAIATPTLIPTSIPTILPTPTPEQSPRDIPTPPPISGAFSPYGIYPNCIAPAIGIEDHSWWWEPSEQYPRHLHAAACAPNTRDTNGSYVWVDPGDVKITVRVMMFNNPGELVWVRGGYTPNGDESTANDCGAPVCQRTSRFCQSSPDELKECTYYFDMNFKTNSTARGLRELRISPDVRHRDLGTRQFPTLNFQMYLKGSGSASNYVRKGNSPIVRSWYDETQGFGYANFNWPNYIALLGTDVTKNIPVLSGKAKLQVNHSEGGFNRYSKLFINPNFHAFPDWHTTAVVGEPGPAGAQMLYDVAGNKGTDFEFDTTQFPDGKYNLYFQTEDRKGDAANFGGMNAGAMKVEVIIKNH